MEEWKTIEPDVWKPQEAGDNVTGILINKEPADESRQLSARYSLEMNGKQVLVWGSTVLDDRMKYVNVGDKVRITFKEMTKNKRGQDVKIFKVEVAN